MKVKPDAGPEVLRIRGLTFAIIRQGAGSPLVDSAGLTIRTEDFVRSGGPGLGEFNGVITSEETFGGVAIRPPGRHNRHTLALFVGLKGRRAPAPLRFWLRKWRGRILTAIGRPPKPPTPLVAGAPRDGRTLTENEARRLAERDAGGAR